MKWVKLSSKMMKLRFMPCEPWYIEQYCHGSCCRSSVQKDGISVVIHKNERVGLSKGLKYIANEFYSAFKIKISIDLKTFFQNVLYQKQFATRQVSF